MTPTNIKLGLGIALFAVWTALVLLKVDGAADLITFIKLTLLGLGAYHLNDKGNTP